ncbi:lipocalin-like domain-containing protein [Sphingobacterium faecale]|uniref:Lipocalin family protein n=1 Tax=Sphingobacterium faecale TaxID=2803775 RepID=A0ABS1QZT7_9SPHI|nr:lipocalin family protein [Sphingobacterium faecale]MBL1407590.1 lipocalin family protein [Sphingobacterium faecale]
MMYWRMVLLLLVACCAKVSAQEIDVAGLIGVWKLERSGFIEAGTEVIKDFDACRLSRNFVFRSDNTVDYTYYEGNLDTCYVAEVETYQWKLEGDTLVLESRGYVGYYLLKMEEKGDLRMEAVKEESTATGDEMLDKMLNTVHFDVYRKQSKPVNCADCRVVLKL